MTDHVSANAARTRRKQTETAPQGQRSSRQKKFDRDLAALEALLAKDLGHAKSPPIAANDEESGAGPVRAKPRGAARKSGEPRRARRAPPPAENFNDAPMPQVGRNDWMRAFEAELLREEDEPAFSRMNPVDLDDYAGRTEPVFEAREPRPTPARNPLNAREPFYVRPDDRRAPIARALRIGATVFSMLALVGVSALLVLLAAGGDRSATRQGEVAAVSAKQTAANESAAPRALPVEEDDVLVTGSAGAKTDGRIAAESQPLPRGGGIVRAVQPGETVAQPRQAADNAPALTAPDASADRSVLAAEPAVAPQADTAPAAAPESASEPAAPTQVATIDNARTAEPQAALRTVPVTTHVNMRATADNDGAVVAVVPAGKDVGVVECKQWCEVTYNDQQGFIHKRFLKE